MKFPNPIRFLVSLLWSCYAWVRGYSVLVPDEVEDRRRAICLVCDQYLPLCEDLGQCEKCTCIVEAKVKLSAEECPIGKWKRNWQKKAKKHTV